MQLLGLGSMFHSLRRCFAEPLFAAQDFGRFIWNLEYTALGAGGEIMEATERCHPGKDYSQSGDNGETSRTALAGSEVLQDLCSLP